MSVLISSASFAFSIVLPSLLLMGLGFFLRWHHKISREFINDASHLVFQYSLPCLLFLSLFNTQVDIKAQLPLIGAGVVVTLLLFVGAEVYAHYFITKSEDKGVFVQGVFRSNIAIIALATIHNAYGHVGLGIGAVYMGVLMVLFNVLAVMTLSHHGSRQFNTQSKTTAQTLSLLGVNLIKNPLNIALLLAVIAKALDVPTLPASVVNVGELLARVALPLALICAGATVNFKDMLSLSGVSMQASLIRIFIAPMLAILVGWAFGLIGGVAFIPHANETADMVDMAKVQMGVLFLMVSAPTAVVSYVMVKAMGGNEILAANIIAFTTIFSMISMAVGSAVLRAMGWM